MSETDQELARDLGFLEAYTIGLGTMIGAGIFVLPSIAADQAGPVGMVSFFAGGLVSLLAALSLSELATGMPKAGGSYYYVNRAQGPFFGSIVRQAYRRRRRRPTEAHPVVLAPRFRHPCTHGGSRSC